MIQNTITEKKKSISCSESDIAYLSARDPIFGDEIFKIGKIERTFYPDFFEGFANAMIGQQISTKAMETIWSRLNALCKTITPETVLNADTDQLRSCGISIRKIEYLIQCAKQILDGTLQVDALGEMTDEEVQKKLTSLNGVGNWTAEMLLIFTFGRNDILSYGDYGIKKGICVLHGIAELNIETFTKFKDLYSPCGTAASFYLWEIAKRA